MTDAKTAALAAIEEQSPLLTELSDTIWSYAELSLQEYKSAELYCRVLAEQGFTVERGLSGIETAFSAGFGSGGPVIGLLAEYDALAGLSQKGGAAEKSPLVPGGAGHGCGHNLLGVGALAAALGVKRYLEKTGCPGRVVLFGCPGEEGGAAKAFMARDGLWRGLDAALTWHPDCCNEVVTGSTNACIQVQYLFHGTASHAAGAPEKGRSALDAVTLMNLGTEFLREHIDGKCRVHYTVTNGGGYSPNVVPAEASVLYMVRSDQVKKALDLQQRVDAIAQGAALMTGTTFTRKFIDGLTEIVPNHTLEQVLYENFAALGAPGHTAEELALADALAATYDARDFVPGCGGEDPDYAGQVKPLQGEHTLNDFLLPLYTGESFSPTSTDVGDVSWECPTAQIHVAAWPNGCPAHSWQNVSCGKSTIGHKAMLQAGKVLCAAAIDLLTEPQLLERAKEEFAGRTAGGYHCPIPAGAVPTVPE